MQKLQAENQSETFQNIVENEYAEYQDGRVNA
jgi:hypothetical protein